MTAVFNPEKMCLELDPQGSPDLPWIVCGEHTFCDGSRFLTIEDGFRTDLASVPLLLAVVFPPDGRHQRSAAHHDSAYRDGNISRFSADAAFREIMAADGVPRWRRVLMFWGVRLFGWIAWQKYHGGRK